MPAKRSLRQIEKQQRRRDKSETKGKSRIEKTIGTLDIPDMSSEELIEQLKRMKAITPTSLAVHYNIKVSTAKRLLNDLREQQIINLESRSHNLKIYTIS
jgi:ribosomal protein S25